MKFVSTLAMALVLAALTTAQGTWTNVANWPTHTIEAYAIHTCHLRPTNPAMGNKGRFLFWGLTEGEGNEPWIWDPYANGGAGTFVQTALAGELDYRMMACGQTLMKDGKVIVVGSDFGAQGQPNNRVSIFNPDTDTWSTQDGRWLTQNRFYPAITRMPYGEPLVAGGQRHNGTLPGTIWIRNNPYEYNPDITNANANWINPTTNDFKFVNFPQLYPLGANEVFFAGAGLSVYADPPDPPPFPYQTFAFKMPGQTTTPLGGETEIWFRSTSAMIRPGVILKCGGFNAPDRGTPDPPAEKRTEMIELTQVQDRAWEQKADMNHARLDFNLVLMADGNAFAVGGSETHGAPNTAVRTPEIYNYATNTWTTVPDHSANFRASHSTSWLLPDGRIALAGSNQNPNPSGEIYTPVYCTNGTRPNILTAPDVILVGVTRAFAITVDDPAVNGAALIALGSMTHSWDTNQRYIPLTVSGTGSTKWLYGLTTVAQTPLGWYMLFVTKPAAGGGVTVCNLAKYVHVDAFAR
ncbi:MAG: galactose oxidase early set domain-containing protein [Armatimonadota bacterium]|nr:galactose oxidase early set domain-containing protein [Armatimonadota bacterium]